MQLRLVRPRAGGCRLNRAGVSRRNLFEEVPITIRNSALVNVFISELEEKQSTFNFEQLEVRVGTAAFPDAPGRTGPLSVEPTFLCGVCSSRTTPSWRRTSSS